jgi:hypothetical protein
MGKSNTQAKSTRQKASWIPRCWGDQNSSKGALTKKPLVLQSSAAATISKRPFVGAQRVWGSLEGGWVA